MTPLVAVSVVLALVFAVPAFGGPSALSVAKKAQKTAKKALAASKKKVTSKRLATHAVTGSKIANRAVTSAKLADGSISTADLADGSVGTAKIVNKSVTIQDLAGADVTGALNIPPITAHTCSTFAVNATGAAVGDTILSSFVGSTAVPAGLSFEPLKVTAPNTINYRICNPSNADSTTVAGLGIRVITLR